MIVILEIWSFKEGFELYDEVEIIDGFIMITQYDIPWREDIFKGWHFYDVSQSMEFILKGYKIVIPNQENSWRIHECGITKIKNDYQIYRKMFLKEYSEKFI